MVRVFVAGRRDGFLIVVRFGLLLMPARFELARLVGVLATVVWVVMTAGCLSGGTRLATRVDMVLLGHGVLIIFRADALLRHGLGSMLSFPATTAGLLLVRPLIVHCCCCTRILIIFIVTVRHRCL